MVKDWIAYCRVHVNEDLWGLIALDYFHSMRKAQSSNREELTGAYDFLVTLVTELRSSVRDPVAFHRVLLAIATQLLHPVDKTFEVSRHLLSFGDVTDKQRLAVAEHFRLYGREQEFITYMGGPEKEGPRDGLSNQTLISIGNDKGQGREEVLKTAVKDLQAKLETALERLHGPKDINLDQEKYLDQFSRSGVRKGELLLNEIMGRLKEKVIDPEKLAVISIGGADGSEIEYLLKTGPFRHGILIEHMHVATEAARKKAGILEHSGKHLEIFEGDAVQKLSECNEYLQRWRAEGKIQGVVFSINSLIHEMKTRTTKFDLRQFIHELAGDWNPLLLSIREPCSPEKWPPKVEMKIPGVRGDTLKRFADAVGLKCKIRSTVNTRSGDFVLMSGRLATEVLFKVFYLEDLDYELEESVTAFSSHDLRTALELEFQDTGQVEPIHFNSGSFNQLFQDYKVQCRDAKGKPIYKPVVFFRLLAIRS